MDLTLLQFECHIRSYIYLGLVLTRWSLPKLVLCVVVTLSYRNLSKVAAVMLFSDSLFTRSV